MTAPLLDLSREPPCCVVLNEADDFEGWRDSARALAGAGVPPDAVVWLVGDAGADLFAGAPFARETRAGFPVPRAFVDLARDVVCHADPERFALLYAMLLRLKSDRRALEDEADPLVHRLLRLAREVRRAIHKMHAFVRFREVEEAAGQTRFVAFFEPEHAILRAASGFFVRRFANMQWSILTPALSIHWDGETLREGPGATAAEAPGADPLEASWKTYYAAIFNPARLKVGAMLKEMPKKYWRNMPETALVAPLIAEAGERERTMIARARTGDT